MNVWAAATVSQILKSSREKGTGFGRDYEHLELCVVKDYSLLRDWCEHGCL